MRHTPRSPASGPLAILVLAWLAGAAAPLAVAQNPTPSEDGFTPLFNGTDLKGWASLQGGPATWTVKDGILVVSGRPAGTLRTEKMFENFILDVEWRHPASGGNSGIFLWSDALPAPGQPFARCIEVQVRDGTETPDATSQGDIFAINGARLTPDRPHPKGWERCLASEARARPSPEWNHYRITAQDGRITLAVNGKEVSGISEATPRKGYLGLESEGYEVHFRNLRIKELPPAAKAPAPGQIAQADQGFRALLNGLDLAAWKFEPVHQGHWTVRDWVLDYDGRGDTLWSREEFTDFQLLVDWRWTAPPADEPLPVVLPNGDTPVGDDGKPKTVMAKVAGDSGIYLRGSEKSQVNIWCWPVGSGEVYGYRTDPAMPPEVRAGVTPKLSADAPIGSWNRFVITMKGEFLTVVLNGKTVIENAQLPGVPTHGPIALQHHGTPIQFANLLVRPLN